MPAIILASCQWLVDGTGPRLDSDDPQLARALTAAGADVQVRAWDDPDVDWGAADAVVVRTTWDYQQRLDEFVAWADAVDAATLLLPGADVIRWNTHKSYLIELEDRGAPVVPTAWLGAGDQVDLRDLAAARGWRRVVAKPVVGAAGRGLLVADPATDTVLDMTDPVDLAERADAADADAANAADATEPAAADHDDAANAAANPAVDAAEPAAAADADGSIDEGSTVDASAQQVFADLTMAEDVMVQPLLDRVRGEGELSFVVLDGRVAHVVRKQPASEQWRIHIEVGGTYEQVEVDADLERMVAWLVAQLPSVPAIARVDLLPSDDLEWQVGEVELVEPALYLDWVDGAAEAVATTILDRVARA